MLATLTYYFIEPKLRYGKNGNKKALGLFLVMFAIGIYGVTEYKYNYTQHINSRFKNELSNIPEWYKLYNKLCFIRYQELKNQGWGCYIESDKGKNISVALMGDSHSGQLLPGLLILNKRIYNIHSIAVPGHVPYYGFESETINRDQNWIKERRDGAKVWDRAFMDELQDPNVKVFVLAHNPRCSRNDITDTQNPNSTLSSDELHLIGAKRTFDLLKQYNKQVIIVKDDPQLPFAPQKCQPRPITFHKSLCSFDRTIFDKFEPRNFYNGILEKVAKDYDNISFIDLSDKLCDKTRCYIKIGNKVIYRDKDHLNNLGSIYVAPMIDEAIKKALKK